MTPDALAKSAREKLALALNALQNSPDTPVELLDLAAPIAQTMGILHRIERSQGKDLAGRDQVLANIRSTLNSLQTMPVSHPAIDAVMEQVAGCLASAHQLARLDSVAAPPMPLPAPAAGLAPVVPTSPGGVAAGFTAKIPPPLPKEPASPRSRMREAMTVPDYLRDDRRSRLWAIAATLFSNRFKICDSEYIRPTLDPATLTLSKL